jgi:hypothetical protein
MSGDNDSSSDDDGVNIVEISRRRLSNLKSVGEGTFGAVYKGIHLII